MVSFFILAANLLPLAGVWFWGWDAFLVLMVYWAETVIVGGWTLARIATMPDPDAIPGQNPLGQTLINLAKTLFFALHSGIFIGVHLVFLLTLFAGEWASRMNGPLVFLHALFIETGAWVALVFAFLAGLIGFVTATPQPTIVTSLSLRFGLTPLRPGVSANGGMDQLGPVIGALYTRIIVMQFGILLGAWVAELFGSVAPLVIVIVLKTLLELGGWTPFRHAAKDKSGGGAEPVPRQKPK